MMPASKAECDPGCRLLLVDDHALVRAGIRALFERIEDVTVVAEAASGREAVRLAESLRPDLISMDIALPDVNGLEATIQLVRLRLRVMIVSMHLNEEYVLQALRAGAMAYLPKDSGPAELAGAVAAVRAGEVWLPSKVTNLLAAYLRRTGDGVKPPLALTPRQREVLQMIAEGTGTKEIAHLLGVSVKTVETHRAQLMERLGIRDIAGLVRYALRVGLASQGA